MGLFDMFNKDKKNTEINNANKQNLISTLTQIGMSCKNVDAQKLIRDITSRLSSQSESSKTELVEVDSKINNLLASANTAVLKGQYATAIIKLYEANEIAIERMQLCPIGGRQVSGSKKASFAKVEETREEQLQKKVEELSAKLTSYQEEKEILKKLNAETPNNAVILSRATTINTKISSTLNQINAVNVEIQREGVAVATIEVSSFADTLVSDRTITDTEMQVNQDKLIAQNQERAETQANNAAAMAALNQGAVGLFGNDPFAETNQGLFASVDPFGNTVGATAGQTADARYGTFNGNQMTSTAMINDVKKALDELERCQDMYDDKIQDSNDELLDLNAQLRPLLERRRNASPSECLMLDSQIDRLNAKRTAVMSAISSYSQASSALSDKAAMVEQLKTQQDLMLTNEKIDKLTGGKFSDIQGMAMFINDAIEQGNQKLEEIRMAKAVADATDIETGSASAANAVLSDMGGMTKDENKYAMLEASVGLAR